MKRQDHKLFSIDGWKNQFNLYKVTVVAEITTKWLLSALFFAVCGVVCPVKGLAGETEGLDKLSIEELMDSKVVTATRSEQQLVDTAAAAYVISQDDIRRSGATTIPETLRMVPGLHVARISPAKWAISARGFNGLVADKLLVMMDGRSLYSPINKGVFWEIQDRLLDDIERIEVIRGPGASVWGANAVNGVINIITKHSSDTKEGSITLFSGSKHGANFRKGWQFSDNGYARVYGKFLRDESFANFLGNDAQEDWTSGRGGFRLDWANPDGKHALMAQGDIFYGDYNDNGSKYQDTPVNQFTLNREVKKGGNLLARWNYTPSLDSRMSAQLFYDNFQTRISSRPDLSLMSSDTLDFDFQHVLALNESHELTYGLNYRLSRVELEPSNLNISEFREYFPKTFENHRFAVFFQDKWRWSDELEIIFGSKFEHHNNNDFDFEPSLRVLWKVADRHRLWAGISRAVRLPAVTDLSSQISDPFYDKNGRLITQLWFNQNENFTSDVVISYELGYRFWYGEDFSLDVAAYYNEYDNYKFANTEFYRLYNYDNSFRKSDTVGVETTVAWHPLDWARFQFSASFMDKYFKSIQDVDVNLLPKDPQFQAAFRSSFDITPEVELDFWLRYSDSFSGYPGQTINSYVSLDTRLAWKPIKNLELSFIANNLNDSQHPEFYEGNNTNTLQVERMFWLQGNLKF